MVYLYLYLLVKAEHVVANITFSKNSPINHHEPANQLLPNNVVILVEQLTKQSCAQSQAQHKLN
jgi:hypothetical protein